MKKMFIGIILGSCLGTFVIAESDHLPGRFYDLIVQTLITADTLTVTLTMPDDSVTTDKIAADAITSIKISDGQVTTAKIGASAVTTVKMYLDLPTERAACITSAKILGTCSSLQDASGGCTCG